MARGPSQWRQLGLKPERSVIAAMIGLTVIWLALRLVGSMALYRHVLLTPRLAIGREPWQLLSSGFVHLGLGQLVMTLVMLIFFGNPIEQMMGERAFWRVFAGGAVGGALAAGLVGRLIAPDAMVPIYIASTTGLLMAFGAAWRGQPVMAYGIAQMRASTMAWIFFGISVVSVLAQIEDVSWRIVVLELAGLAGAAAAGWFLAGGQGRGGSLRDSFDRLRMWRLRRRYRVLTGGRDARDQAGGDDRGPPRWMN